jgi:predicted acetyltransferase
LRPTEKVITKTVPVVRTVNVPMEFEVHKYQERPVDVEIEKTVHQIH